VLLVTLAAVACGGPSGDEGAAADTTIEEPAPAGPGAGERATAPTVIIDTDLSLWWDDATALGLANVLVQRGELRVAGFVSNVPNAAAAAAIDAIDTAYGNPDIPVGAVAGSAADTFPHGYTDALVRRLGHPSRDRRDVPGAVELYREVLARQDEGAVTIVAIGGYTNLAGLLASGPDAASALDGRELVRSRVGRLVVMDGLFPDGAPPLTNQEIDPAAATAVVTGDWPTPIAWVDGSTGVNTRVGGTLCAEVAADHPMRIVYEELFACGPPGDGNWDAPTLLHAVGGLDGAFEELGRGGAAVLNESGGLRWAPQSPRTDDVYVHVADQELLNGHIDRLLVAG
jgi:hypothetical protein